MSFKHENILNIIDDSETSDFFYEITEYCEGGSLKDLMKSKSYFEETEILSILK
jgi:serine/threonine protein kinase